MSKSVIYNHHGRPCSVHLSNGTTVNLDAHARSEPIRDDVLESSPHLKQMGLSVKGVSVTHVRVKIPKPAPALQLVPGSGEEKKKTNKQLVLRKESE